MKKLLMIVLALGFLTSLSVIAGNSDQNSAENVNVQSSVDSINNAQSQVKAPQLDSIDQTRQETAKSLAVINRQPAPPKELRGNMNSIDNVQNKLVNSLNNDAEQLEETPVDKNLLKAGEHGVDSLMKTEGDKGQAVFNQKQITPEELAKAEADKNTRVLDEQQAPPINRLIKANQESVDSGVDAYANSVKYNKQLKQLPPLKVPVKHEGIMQN